MLCIIIQILFMTNSYALTELICVDTDVNGFVFDVSKKDYAKSSFKKQAFKIVLDNNQSSIMMNIPGMDSASEFRCEKNHF